MYVYIQIYVYVCPQGLGYQVHQGAAGRCGVYRRLAGHQDTAWSCSVAERGAVDICRHMYIYICACVYTYYIYMHIHVYIYTRRHVQVQRFGSPRCFIYQVTAHRTIFVPLRAKCRRQHVDLWTLDANISSFPATLQRITTFFPEPGRHARPCHWGVHVPQTMSASAG